MGDLLNAVLLGIVEGLTEFIPVSSTGHLLVAEHFLRLPGERWDAFTVVIQLGAILAVVVVYWRKFWDVLVGLPTSPDARRFAGSVIVACIPAVVVGLFAAKYINAFLLDPARAAPFIAGSWIVGGILILLLERMAPVPRYRDGDRLPLMKAFQIGLCQPLRLADPRHLALGLDDPGRRASGRRALGRDGLHLLSRGADYGRRHHRRAAPQGGVPHPRRHAQHRGRLRGVVHRRLVRDQGVHRGRRPLRAEAVRLVPDRGGAGAYRSSGSWLVAGSSNCPLARKRQR